MKQLPGFSYDARRKRATFDGYVIGTGGKIRRRKTVENVTRAQALSAWKEFRDDLESGRAVEGPLTLRQFVKRYYHLICASHAPATKKAQEVLMKNHLLRYFGNDELTTITSIRVIDFMADMRSRNCSAHYINDAVRVLKMLLRQAYEREVIAEYPIRKRIPKEKEVPLRLELKPDGGDGSRRQVPKRPKVPRIACGCGLSVRDVAGVGEAALPPRARVPNRSSRRRTASGCRKTSRDGCQSRPVPGVVEFID